MPFTIDLSPAQEERLEAAARQRGLAAADLVQQWVTERLPAADGAPPPAASQPLTAPEIICALDALAEMNRDLPVLPPRGRLVAVMQAHGLTHILTLNPAHFRRYPGLTVGDPHDVR